MILEEILEELREVGRGNLSKVAVGLGYTIVVLDDGSAGLSYTPVEDARHECENNPLAGRLVGMGWEEAAELALGPHPILSAAGLATMNALASRLRLRYERGDLMDHLDVRRGDHVCMVGYIPAIANRARKAGAEVVVFEQRYVEDPGYKPWWASEILMDRCDVAIISGATLVNKTLDRLLELSSRARVRAIVGPSTPQVPRAFARRGIKVLAGTRIVDSDMAFKIVAEGGGTMTMYSSGAAEKTVVLTEETSGASC